MVKPENPCVPDCPRRSSTCHGSCPDYSLYKKSLDLYNETVRNSREVPRIEFTKSVYNHVVGRDRIS